MKEIAMVTQGFGIFFKINIFKYYWQFYQKIKYIDVFHQKR